MILVTGATGLSGSMVIREFARNHAPVKALVRNRAKASALEGFPSVEIVEGDMSQPETLGDALRDVDRALMISSSSPQMVETQSSFIDAAKQAGVRHVVKMSGQESGIGFNQSAFRFIRMHQEIERYLEASGLAWTQLRPSQFMQVYFREAPSIKAQNALYLPMENARLSPIDIEDIAQIAYKLLSDDNGQHNGKAYELTGPEALTMTEVAEQLSQAVGRPIRYINVTPEERKQGMLARGTLPYFADALDEQARERRKCSESRVNLSAHKLFGVEPTTFAEFARRNAVVFS